MSRRELPVVALALVAVACICHAQVPALINYQGRLVSGTNLVNQAATIVLSLYDSDVGGTLLCAESNDTVVVDGLYSVLLGDHPYIGSLKAALAGDEVWVETAVEGTTLLPRERLAAVGYALKADGVSTGAITSAMIAAGAVGSIQLANNAVNSNNIAFGAVHAENIALGAVGAPQIANGAVTIAKIGADSVGRLQLIKGYESGRFNVELLAQTNVYDFQRVEVSTTVTFSIHFPAAPVVTLGVTTTNRTFAAESGAAITDKTTNGFTFSIEFSPEAKSVDDASEGADKPSLAMVNGRPAAVTVAATPHTISYARAEDPFGIDWNEPVAIASNADNGPCWASLAVVGSRPALCYRDTNNVLRYMRALDLNGTNWSESVVVDAASGGGYAGNLREVNGHPAIAYRNSTLSQLRYAYSDTVAGTNAADWHVVTLHTNGIPGTYLSMAVIDGNPAIAYFEDASNDLWYVRALNVQGSVWAAPTNILSDSSSGIGVALAEIYGRPAVAFRFYISSSTNMVFFYRADDSVGTAWGSVAYVWTGAVQGTDCQLGIFDGYPTVCFQDSDNDDLLLVKARSTNGTDILFWETPVLVATNGNTGVNPSMVDAHGTPAILFVNVADLRYEYIRSGNPPANSWVDWIAVEP